MILMTYENIINFENRSREKYKIQAREFLRQGNNAKARECFQRCVEVTSDMALQLIKACRAKNVDCIVAPYEADAQLAFLSLKSKFFHNIFSKPISWYIFLFFS